MLRYAHKIVNFVVISCLPKSQLLIYSCFVYFVHFAHFHLFKITLINCSLIMNCFRYCIFLAFQEDLTGTKKTWKFLNETWQNSLWWYVRLPTHSSLVDYLAQVIYAKNCPTTFYCIFQLVWVLMTTTQNIRVCFLSS